MKRKCADEIADLSIIGYSQAGKTTLAAGLYATSDEDFTVIGDGEDTENYLRGIKARLETGHWPNPTKELDSPELCLKIIRPGAPEFRVRFREYMGELATNTENYKRDVIGRPKVALILLNPRMDILTDPIRRVEMLAQLREIVFYLAADDVGCEYVALVTTASDVLETADAKFRDAFLGYKGELVNVLKASRFEARHAWREFSVSVCGKLESQDHPRIARGVENTSRLPFEWAISRIEEKGKAANRRRSLLRIAVAVCAVGFLSALAFIGWYFHIDRACERALSDAVAKPTADLDSAVEKGNSDADILQNCKKLEDAVARSAGDKPFFRGNGERLEEVRRNVRSRIEKGRLAWCPLRFKRMEKSAATEASAENCKMWRADFESWQPSTDDGRRMKEVQLKAFDDAQRGWREQYECRVYNSEVEKLTSDIEKYDANKDDEMGSSAWELLKRCRKIDFQTASTNGLVPLDRRQTGSHVIAFQRTNLLERVMDHRLGSITPEGPNRPRLGDAERDYFIAVTKGDEAMSPQDRAMLFRRLEDRIVALGKEWEKFQQRECENEIKKIDAKSAYDAVKSFGDFYAYHPNAPQLKRVVLALHKKVGKAFQDLVEVAKTGLGNAQNFTETRELCEALSRVKCPAMKKSCWYAFATNCCNEGKMSKGLSAAFPLAYTVTSIDMSYNARSLYEDEPQGQEFQIEFCYSTRVDESGQYENASEVKEAMVVLHKGEHDWQNVWKGSLTKKCNSWSPFAFTVYGKTDGKANAYHRIPCLLVIHDDRQYDIGKQRHYEKNYTGDDTDVDVTFRIGVSVEGKCIWEYLPADTKLEL